MNHRLWILISVLLLSTSVFAENRFPLSSSDYENGGVIVVPSGNSSQSQARSFDVSRYRKALAIILQRENICEVQTAAELYEIDPLSIVGDIIGEHTFNVDMWDMGQEAYLYMLRKWEIRFAGNSLDLADVVREPPYQQCVAATHNHYELWECYEEAWAADRRNPRRGSERSSLKWTFFNPMGAGFTYGYGQMGPERALKVTDLVSEISGFQVVSVDDPNGLYDAVLNPKTAIHYVAASNRIAIEIYQKHANFDISGNLGVIATLYNLGKEREKAVALRQKNLKSTQASGHGIYPDVNFYGWLVNAKEEEMRTSYRTALFKARCP